MGDISRSEACSEQEDCAAATGEESQALWTVGGVGKAGVRTRSPGAGPGAWDAQEDGSESELESQEESPRQPPGAFDQWVHKSLEVLGPLIPTCGARRRDQGQCGTAAHCARN